MPFVMSSNILFLSWSIAALFVIIFIISEILIEVVIPRGSLVEGWRVGVVVIVIIYIGRRLRLGGFLQIGKQSRVCMVGIVGGRIIGAWIGWVIVRRWVGVG
jgi:hypothetical protein